MSTVEKKMASTEDKKKNITINDTKTTPETIVKKRRCRYGMKCKILRTCMRIQRSKDNKELPDYVLEHIKTYSHPPRNVCTRHFTSIPESKCYHMHLGDTEEIKKIKLCFYDLECNNPNCKFLHGWSCPYGIGCKNPICPLIHPIIRDPGNNIVDDKRRHIINNELFGNYANPRPIRREIKLGEKKEFKKIEKKVEEKKEEKN